MDRVNIGIVGCGGRGRYFCDLYGSNPRSRVVAVCDISEKQLEIVRNRWGSRLKYFTDVHDMLKMEKLDAVIIATDTPNHTEPAIASLRAGKHVMLEKPMAQTVEECRRIVEEAYRAEGIFMIGLELRHCILFERVRKLIDDGAIGRVILGLALDNVSVGGNYYYHDKFRRKEYAKSLLLEKAVHSLDLLNWFMGGWPTRVYALGGLDYYGGSEPPDKRCRDCERKGDCPFYIDHERFVMDYGAVIQKDDLCVFSEECTTRDNSQLLISYDNGTRATFTECHFTPEYTREFTFIGDRGKLYALYNNEGNFLIRVRHRFTDHIDEYRPIYTGGHHGGGDLNIMEEFLDCIHEGRQPRANVEAAYYSAVLALCAEESIDTGMPIDIPPIPKR
ncbi:hypothetical protein DRO55_01530 [Candidatus Bathyarchaeota archaeon]|nr:MAG: hypothetical protein DRO55_01530 [Candidatus Bathyarchaeota archaeon]